MLRREHLSSSKKLGSQLAALAGTGPNSLACAAGSNLLRIRKMDNQRATSESGKFDFRFIKSTRRDRIVAGVLALVYAALMALAFYLESIHIEAYWPKWLLWVGGVTGFATLMVLPFLVVRYFFWGDLTPLRRFSLRRLMLVMFWASLIVWYSTQINWKLQRIQWRGANRAVTSTIEGRAPIALRLLGETGASRIEIKNGTQQQIAEAKRLFPEAAIVVAGSEAGATGGK